MASLGAGDASILVSDQESWVYFRILDLMLGSLVSVSGPAMVRVNSAMDQDWLALLSHTH